jgi:hypothetical protein
MRENTWDETISLGDFSLSEQFRFPKETKWLYPQNQAFADAKLVKKEAEVFHQKEVLHNFTKIDYDFLGYWLFSSWDNRVTSSCLYRFLDDFVI